MLSLVYGKFSVLVLQDISPTSCWKKLCFFYKGSMAATSEAQQPLNQDQVTMSSSVETGGPLMNTVPITTTAGSSHIQPLSDGQAPTLTQRALNSTPKDDSILNLSRGSQRSCASVDKDMLMEIQAMNHNIAMMLSNQIKEEK
jgi:hypothetical protein